MIKIALHTPSGRMRHVDHANNGLGCECVCPKCGEILQAVHPEVHQSFFRHHKNVNCLGSQETALHKLAKQIIHDHYEMMVPSQGKLNYDGVVLEPMVGFFRADAKFTVDGKEYFCEVVVKNDVSTKKALFYRTTNRTCIEIDLTSFIGKEYSYEEIKEAVLTSVTNKRLIKNETQIEHQDDYDVLKVFVLLVLAFFGLRALWRILR